MLKAAVDKKSPHSGETDIKYYCWSKLLTLPSLSFHSFLNGDKYLMMVLTGFNGIIHI